MPLDADTFTRGSWLTWLQSKSPFQNVYGKTKTRLLDMVKNIATQIADDGQSQLDGLPAIADGEPPSVKDICAFAGVTPSASDVKRAMSVTLEDLKQLHFEKLHSPPHLKPYYWALENEQVDASSDPALHATFRRYCKALEALAPKPPRSGKAAHKSASSKSNQAVLDEFRKHCASLGVKLQPERQSDIINLLAAVKARSHDAY
jgi:hypothetical protein